MACSGRQRGHYSPLWALVGMMAICVLMAAGSWLEDRFHSMSNEMGGGERREALAAALEMSEHPTGSETAARRSLAGEFAEGEAGCDLFAGEMRSYDGNQDAVLRTYEEQLVEEARMQVVFLEAGQIPEPAAGGLPDLLSDLAEWDPAGEAGDRPLTIVYVMICDEGEFDCR